MRSLPRLETQQSEAKKIFQRAEKNPIKTRIKNRRQIFYKTVYPIKKYAASVNKKACVIKFPVAVKEPINASL